MTEPHPTQKKHTAKINYEDKEGNKYSEVHGDPEKNLNVVSKAEQEGEVQPNLEGTTPDPHNPELTEFEQERREATDSATAPADDNDGKQTGKPEDKSRTSAANK